MLFGHEGRTLTFRVQVDDASGRWNEILLDRQNEFDDCRNAARGFAMTNVPSSN